MIEKFSTSLVNERSQYYSEHGFGYFTL